jgi:hypothetical protein
LSWLDIETALKNGIQNSPGETDSEKLGYFKEKIVSYLDNLQAEEGKKVISFESINKFV